MSAQPDRPAVDNEPRGEDLLLARLREPADTVRHRWIASGPSEAGSIDLNRLLPLVRTWLGRDPAVAAELVQSALSAQKPNGGVPCRFDTRGREEGPEAPWPLLARSALLVWRHSSDRDFLAAVLPRLDAYLDWAMDHFDPEHTGHACWRSDTEAFSPDTWDRGLATVDLTSMLLAETTALLEMAAGLQDVPVHVPRLEARRDALGERLARFFWDEKARLFRDRYVDGTWVSRQTLSARLPLLWEDLPDSLRDAWFKSLSEADPLLGPTGMLLWEPWADDPMPPPSPPWQQAVVLEGFLASGWERGYDLLTRALTARRAAAPADVPEDGPLARAVLTELVRRGEASAHERSPTAWMTWVDRRPRLAVAGGLVLLAGFLGSVAVFHATRAHIPGSSVEVLGGLARNHYHRGEYRQALDIYERLLETEDVPVLHLLYANTLFHLHRYAEAERHYRKAMAGEENAPLAMFNLAQTLYREGRGEEAASLLEEFIRLHSVNYPEATARSRFALALIRRALPDGNSSTP